MLMISSSATINDWTTPMPISEENSTMMYSSTLILISTFAKLEDVPTPQKLLSGSKTQL